MTPNLPIEYQEYLVEHGAIATFTTGDDMPAYVKLWPKEEISWRNSEIKMTEYAPDFLAFAGNGGGEVLAFDRTGAIYMLHLCDMDPECAIKVARTFSELAGRFDLSA